MHAGELRVIRDVDEWKRLLLRSPQGTRFLDKEFIDLFSVPYTLYGYYIKDVCVAGVPVIDAGQYGSCFLPQCYYQGPFFYDEIYRSANSKKIQYEIELVEHILKSIILVEEKFNFCLHPSFQDVRGYSWLHYNDESKSRCVITPKYTAIIDLGHISHNDIRKLGRSSRRQEEGYAVTREDLHVCSDGCLDELLDLYRQTFHRQGIKVNPSDLSLLAEYCNYFLGLEVGHILTVRNSSNVAVAASFIFEDYFSHWHVPLVGLGSSRYGGTLLYYYIADYVKERGGLKLDFNGANSPQRGYFKHSIGARAQLYFEIKFSK